MKLQSYDIIWVILIIFLVGVIAGITLSEYSNPSTTEITTIVDSIIDARCIDSFDKDLLAVMERVCRKTVAHDPELYAEEQRYFDAWQKRRFAKHNDSIEWVTKNKEE